LPTVERILAETPAIGRPRNLLGLAHTNIAQGKAKNLRTFGKEPTRKAVFRSGGGPRGVLLPFLKRGSQNFISQNQSRRQARSFGQILEIGDFPRVSEPLQACKPVLKLFSEEQLESIGEAHISLILNRL
jgi:hypothetical protein